jgi:8-oxo-dGTP diphosphatase
MKAAPTSSTTILSNLDVRVVVFCLRDERLQVLLVPSRSARVYELPGSPVPMHKSLEETALESILPFTGPREAFLEQLYTYGDTSRDLNERLVSVVYFSIIPAGASQLQNAAASTNKDVEDAKWFPVGELPALAMDYEEIIKYALRRLRYKLEYTAVGFQLLPEYFSLSELQNTYEMILGEKLDKRNFRRRILQAGIIEETSHRRSGEGRPARLYRYQPDAVAEVKARRLFP